MKSREIVAFSALSLSLAAGSFTEAHAQKKSPKASSPPAPSGAPSAAASPAEAAPSAADIDLLIELAGARSLPPGLDESSPELAKIVSLVRAGKTQAALPLVASYAKANEAQLVAGSIERVTGWIVRRALLLPNKQLYTTADQLRFARQGQLTLKKYRANLAKKSSTQLAFGFLLAAYADGADAVKHDAKKKTVGVLRGEIDAANEDLAERRRSSTSALQALKQIGEILSNIAKARDEISKTLARNTRA